MARLLDPCLRVVREWLPVPDIVVRHAGPRVEGSVTLDSGRGDGAVITLDAMSLTVRTERGQRGNPKNPYQAFVRTVSLPWEVLPQTTEIQGHAGCFHLTVRRARKEEVGERVQRESEEAGIPTRGRDRVAT